ncbi:extracellular solute-binding protein, partial [Pelagibacterales bacterium SAG-MED31]|nr:extracellular solute-binding protein [Pelagibacterales bacterium SAG-MED31]
MSKLLKVFLIASFAVASFSAKAVTVASWGGAYTESQQKAYADTYTDPSSIQFENYNGGLGEVRAQVESGSVTWDLVDVLPGDAITGCDEGLFEDITSEIADLSTPGPDGESMLEDMENNGLEYHSGWDCCVPQIFWTYVVFYDPDAFPGDKPSSMADFFDVEKFPGKRGI